MYALPILLAATVVSGDGNSIDSLLAAEWARRNVQPVARCSDDEFLRRVHLDLVGRIPTLAEIKKFRRQPDRAGQIDLLLASDEFPKFFAATWTAALNGYTNSFGSDREALRSWLEESLAANRPYDWLVTQLITARGASALAGATNFLVRHPEDPAVRVCRLFLGVRLDCARCHDHPFDRWTQEDFRRMSRFFEATERREVSEGNIRLVNRVPDTNEENRPRFLTGAQPRTGQWRDELALFLVNCKPFARNYANRLWYQLLGKGIVDPVDDLSRENPPVMPELLEYLAEVARAESFDIRLMVRRICQSRAYQLSAHHTGSAQQLERLFAKRVLKPLTPEQTVDSAARALGIEIPLLERRELIERMVEASLDEDFSETWKYRETVQGLMRRLDVSLPASSASLEEIYLRILSREPTKRELEICEGRAVQDVVFALLNSNEFFFSH